MIEKLFVKCNDKIVGTLALTKDKKVAFQYDESWVKNGFSISPFSLPLDSKVRVPSNNCFSGLFGVFADSLPDNWGNLLLDRMLNKYKVDKDQISVLDKLSLIGKNGMGILSYEPAQKLENNYENDLSLDQLSVECEKILNSKDSELLEQIYHMGGSSGGARPKALISEKDGTHWIVKFSNTVDSIHSGKIEFDYFECARRCGINVPNTKLYDSKISDGFFGIERFDIKNAKRIHMITVSGLLEADYRSSCLDYSELIKLTKILTCESDTYEMFRRMCFNVFSHNMDDHAKNFSFLYDMDGRKWRLSPAYDLTYSNTYFNEHTTSVNGKGKNISESDLLSVGLKNNLNKNKCLTIMLEVKSCVFEMLNKYINQ